MNRLEDMVRTSITSYFAQQEERKTEDLQCGIPPEIWNSTLELLVAPVTAAVIADFLIRKLSNLHSGDTEGLRSQVEQWKALAQKEIQNKVRRLGAGKSQANALFVYTTQNAQIKIEIEQFDGDVTQMVEKIKALLHLLP